MLRDSDTSKTQHKISKNKLNIMKAVGPIPTPGKTTLAGKICVRIL